MLSPNAIKPYIREPVFKEAASWRLTVVTKRVSTMIKGRENKKLISDARYDGKYQRIMASRRYHQYEKYLAYSSSRLLLFIVNKF